MGSLVVGLLVAAGASVANRPADGVLYLVPSPRAAMADLFLIDPATGNARNVTRTEGAEEVYPAWSPDGRHVAFCCRTKEHNFEIYVCDADGSNRRRLTTSPGGQNPCLSPTWAPNGLRLAYTRLSPGEKAEVRVVEADVSDDVMIADDAAAPAWSPDGKSIAVVKFNADGRTGRLVLLSPDGKTERVLVPQVGAKTFCHPAWSPDGSVIAYPAETLYGLQLFLVSPAGGPPRQLTHLLGVNMHPVWVAPDRLLFSHFAQPSQPAGAYATIKTDGTRLDTHPLTKQEPAHLMIRPAVWFPRPEPRADSEPPAVRTVGFTTPAAPTVNITPVVVIPPLSPGMVGGLAWSPDSSTLAIGTPAGPVALFEFGPRGARAAEALKGHEGPVEGLAFAPGGKFLYSSGADKSVRVWDVAAGGAKAVVTDHDEWAGAVAVSADGKFLASAAQDGVVKVRAADTGAPVHELRLSARRAEAHAVAFGKDGVLFAGGGRWDLPVFGGAVAAFDPATGKELWHAKGSFGGVWALAVSPDGSRVIGACLDHRIRVWDAKTGAEQAAWKGHTDRVTGVAVSPDGRTVVSCGFDHTVRVWDAGSGALLQTLAAHACPAVRVAFSPDGKHVATSGVAGAVFIWKVGE